ncbi:MAG: hypothetical protein J6R35_00625 [Clostridia bacterium]|nr:hypothetical protein [Clostridia bacterium]
MVTLRRDVAVENSNRLFDRVDRDQTLTQYDLFMLEKRRNEQARNYGSATVSSTMTDFNEVNYFGAPQITVEEPKQEKSFDSYDEYMVAQLHRKSSDEKLLTSEEFYAEKYESQKPQKARKSIMARKQSTSKLTKFAKIFISVYVLVTVAVASIILALNVTKSEPVKLVATAQEPQQGQIGALAVEWEEETNWFDSMLDAVSNK